MTNGTDARLRFDDSFSERRQRRNVAERHIAYEVEAWMANHRNAADVPTLIPADTGHLVYVARSISGEALYVGVTSNMWSRIAGHQRGTPWWEEVHTLALHPARTRGAANRLEIKMIRTLRPRYNLFGYGRKRDAIH